MAGASALSMSPSSDRLPFTAKDQEPLGPRRERRGDTAASDTMQAARPPRILPSDPGSRSRTVDFEALAASSKFCSASEPLGTPWAPGFCRIATLACVPTSAGQSVARRSGLGSARSGELLAVCVVKRRHRRRDAPLLQLPARSCGRAKSASIPPRPHRTPPAQRRRPKRKTAGTGGNPLANGHSGQETPNRQRKTANWQKLAGGHNGHPPMCCPATMANERFLLKT
jgi:hypothetical protein